MSLISPVEPKNAKVLQFGSFNFFLEKGRGFYLYRKQSSHLNEPTIAAFSELWYFVFQRKARAIQLHTTTYTERRYILKTVILLVGPQGSGKSTFCRKVVNEHPGIEVVSRDEIYLTHFRKGAFDTILHDFDPRHASIFAKMWDEVASHVQKSDMCLILDCWNETSIDRRHITEKLRSLGVDKIGAWYFTTPMEDSIEWLSTREQRGTSTRNVFLIRDPSQKIFELARRAENQRKYRLFHLNKVETIQGFDFVVEVNPLSPPSSEQLFAVIPPPSTQ